MCGGTRRRGSGSWCAPGLSPRVRGNRGDPHEGAARQRSIPACAGEPCCWRVPCQLDGVYPRVCGGTSPAAAQHHHSRGLSPRVRGNRWWLAHPGRKFRSIPACAGEPPDGKEKSDKERVYPRVCGGTKRMVCRGHRHNGLSPRVRGNHVRGCEGARVRRSIPACAGEPRWARPVRAPASVYPRVCGGTPLGLVLRHTSSGLSPRVRGNPSCSRQRKVKRGSIPACAGEPRVHALGSYPVKVYPRVCGGTPKRSLLVLTFAIGVTP